MPIVPQEQRLDCLRRKVLMSRNIRAGWLVDLAMGGLNYQIEHHLFPSLPRANLRRARPIVRAFCQERGIPYAETSLFGSYRIVVRYLNTVDLGPVTRSRVRSSRRIAADQAPQRTAAPTCWVRGRSPCHRPSSTSIARTPTGSGPNGGRDTWGWASTNYARPQTTVDAHVKVGVTDFLPILHGDHPTVAGEHLAALLPALRELG